MEIEPEMQDVKDGGLVAAGRWKGPGVAKEKGKKVACPQ